MTDPVDFRFIRPEDLYDQELESWRSLWSDEFSLYENLANLASKCVMLPRQDIQLPIAATYLFTSSKWSKVLPILFSYGEKGSGKSTFSILACKLRGLKSAISAADTFASIRNILDSMRWEDLDTKNIEKDGAILCWDNVYKETFTRDPRLYQLVLSGYNRATDRIAIADSAGFNRYYHVFCPKIMSSVQPLMNDVELDELSRRLIIIKHKEWSKFNESDKTGLDNSRGYVDELIDLNDYSFSGINELLNEFWNSEDNIKTYIRYRSGFSKMAKSKLPEQLNSHRWTISIDIAATGLLLGTWSTKQQAINAIADYWEYAGEIASENEYNVSRLLRQFIEEECKHQIERNIKAASIGIEPEPLEIGTNKLKQFLLVKQAEGSLDVIIQPQKIKDIMQSLGWQLMGVKWIKIQ